MTRRPPRRVRVGNRGAGLWWRVPVALACWLLVAAPQAAALATWVIVRDAARSLPDVPDVASLPASAPQSSRIVSRDGTLLAVLPFDDGGVIGHRDWTPQGSLPPPVVRAILAAEDVRFFEHPGVDLAAVTRAAWINFQARETRQGASTLTQQLARNLLPDTIGTERTWRRKLREALMAYRLERQATKAQLLEAYANLPFLGAGAYGVAAAARTYFGKELEQLSWSEAALIAGMAQAPSRRNPFDNPEAAIARRDEVLRRAHRAGFIDEATLAEALAETLQLVRPPSSVVPGITEAARRDAVELVGPALGRGGLTIVVAPVPATMLQAEAIAAEHAARAADPPQAAAYFFDHTSGYVEVLVGGVGPDAGHFDRARQACRQPGSAFKPLVYAAALEDDLITAATLLRDAPVTEYDMQSNTFWKPRSDGVAFTGAVIVHDALTQSLNAPAVALIDDLGIAEAVAFARRMGITTELAPYRPLVLGASCTFLSELAAAYSVFAAGGAPRAPTVIVSIRRGESHLIDRTSPFDVFVAPGRRLDRLAGRKQPERLLDGDTSTLVGWLLAAVVQRGTGTSARTLPFPVAGKTGTTNENTDALFVGFSPRVTGGVWLGHDTPRPMGRGRDGSRAALPLWIDLMRLVETGHEKATWPHLPTSIGMARIERSTGLLARPGTPALELPFRAGTEPTEQSGAVREVPADLGRTLGQF